MTELEGRHDVTYGSLTVGAVNITKNGIMMKIDCICLNSPRGIMRLAGVSGDNVMSFGILIPDGDRLRLTRSFSKNDLLPISRAPVSFCIVPADIDIRTLAKSAQGSVLIEGSEESADLPPDQNPPGSAPDTIIPPAAFSPDITPSISHVWREIQAPESLFSDEELQNICSGITGALYKEEGDLCLLAVPINCDDPFPLMPVFCCGEPENIEEKEYVVFKIRDGRLWWADE